MVSLLFYIVLVITCNQTLARSLSNLTTSVGDKKIKTKNRSKSDEFEFKLPKKVSHGLLITINGTIASSHPRLTMELPNANDEMSCQIVYDFENNIIYSSHSSPEKSELENKEGTTFSLSIKARLVYGGGIFDVTFTENGEGGHPIVFCKAKNFEDFNVLKITEGVTQITSLLFEF